MTCNNDIPIQIEHTVVQTKFIDFENALESIKTSTCQPMARNV